MKIASIQIQLVLAVLFFSSPLYANNLVSHTEEALIDLSEIKNHGKLLEKLMPQLSADDYSYLKMKADELNINQERKLDFKKLGGREIKLGKNHFVFSSSGKILKYKGQNFRLHPKKSLMGNFIDIESKVKRIKNNTTCSLNLPCAYAQEEPAAYNIAAFLYWMKSLKNN